MAALITRDFPKVKLGHKSLWLSLFLCLAVTVSLSLCVSLSVRSLQSLIMVETLPIVGLLLPGLLDWRLEVVARLLHCVVYGVAFVELFSLVLTLSHCTLQCYFVVLLWLSRLLLLHCYTVVVLVTLLSCFICCHGCNSVFLLLQDVITGNYIYVYVHFIYIHLHYITLHSFTLHIHLFASGLHLHYLHIPLRCAYIYITFMQCFLVILICADNWLTTPEIRISVWLYMHYKYLY